MMRKIGASGKGGHASNPLMTVISRIFGPAASRAILPYAAMLGSMLSLSVGTSFAKQLFPLVGAPGTSAYRVGFSALFLLILWRPWRRAWTRAELMDLGRYGAALGLLNLCFYQALQTIPFGIALAIEFVGPLGVALFHSRRLSHFLWIGLVVLGLGLLLPIRAGTPSLDPLGVGYAAASAALWALYIIFGQRAARVPSGYAVSVGMLAAALVVVPVGFATAGIALLTPTLLAMGFVAAIVSSALPFSLEMIALKGLPKRIYGVLASGEPAVGAIAGIVFLHERLAWLQWLAIGCIIAAGIGSVVTAGTTEHEARERRRPRAARDRSAA